MTARREQEVVERLEGPALVRLRDALAAAQHLIQQFTLGPVPSRDLAAQIAVQIPEIRLDLTEVGQKPMRRIGHLLITVPQRRAVQNIHLAGPQPARSPGRFRDGAA